MKLIHDDCRQALQNLINDNIKVDLVVTSPPYDTLRDYDNSLVWDFEIFKEIARLLYEILCDGGVCVWIVNDKTVNGSETGTSFKQALYFKEIGFNLHDTMIYQKTSITHPSFNRYYSCFEYMFILSKGKPKTTNLIEDRPNKRAGEIVTGTQRESDGSLREMSSVKKKKRIKDFGVRHNVWVYDVGNGKSAENKIAHKHPAIFPLQLAEDHIISWSNEGDTVLDCFMGSCTTGVACSRLNRNFIGIEVNKDYYNLARERLGSNQRRLL